MLYYRIDLTPVAKRDESEPVRSHKTSERTIVHTIKMHDRGAAHTSKRLRWRHGNLESSRPVSIAMSPLHCKLLHPQPS